MATVISMSLLSVAEYQGSVNPRRSGPVRVVIEATHAFKGYRGWGRYNLELLRSLRASDAPFEYDIFYHRDGRPDAWFRSLLACDRMRLHPMDATFPQFDVWEEDRRTSWIERWFPEAHVYHSVTEFPFWTQNLGRVITIHELTPLVMPELHGGVFVDTFRKAITENVNSADAIVAVSENTAAELRQAFPFVRNVQTIWNGVAPFFFEDPSVSRRNRQVLYVGPVRDRIKNFSLLARSLHGVSQAELVVVSGEPDAQAYLLWEFPWLSGLARLEVCGQISDEALRDLYRQSGCLVFPSLHEGFGLPVIEALACGCPVLCGNHSSLREIVHDEVIRFDLQSPQSLRSALERIWEGSAALHRDPKPSVLRFSWDECARQHEALYSRVASRRLESCSKSHPVSVSL